MNTKKSLIITFLILFLLSFFYNNLFVYENVILEKYLIAINYDIVELILNTKVLYLKPIQKTYIYLIENLDQNILFKDFIIKKHFNALNNKIYYHLIDYIICLKKKL